MRAALTVALAILPALAAADVIHLADGTTRQGRVVETTATDIVVDVGVGNVSLHVRIPRGDVVRIEHKATANDLLMGDYARRLSRARGADDWHALGTWCLEQRVLKEQGRAAFERALAIDPDHAEAHAALGHVKLNDAWMTRKRAVALLAPELAVGLAQARQIELAARKQTEEARATAALAERHAADLQTQLDALQRENQALRVRLATPPPVVERERIIYRPIIIRPPARKRPSTTTGATRRPAPRSSAPGTSTPDETPKDKTDE